MFLVEYEAAFAEAFTATVNAAVEARLAGSIPKAGSTPAAQSGVEAAFLARNPGLTI